jgi:signal transduction histidine kinase
MVMSKLSSRKSGAKWVPQIVLLLDHDARVISVNRSLAGTSFSTVADAEELELHDHIHSGCRGDCKFKELWTKAWGSLETRDSLEWEISDSMLDKMLRLNLSKPQMAREVVHERRRRHAVLTITDITKYRMEYDALLQREAKLVKLLQKQGVNLAYSRLEDTLTGTDIRTLPNFDRRKRGFGHQVIRAQENERKRIASDLHDGLAQTLGVVKYSIETSLELLKRQNNDLDVSAFDIVIDQIKGALDEVRRISSNLSPSMLDDFGVMVALEWLCNELESNHPHLRAKHSICIDEGDIPDLIKIAIYRLVQEALNNASRHADAKVVEIKLETSVNGVELTVRDDGHGFDLDDARLHDSDRLGLGLRSMRERVEATGGSFEIESSPKKGTWIHALWGADELDLLCDEAVLDGVDGDR